MAVILVTGAAGFIGAALSRRLLAEGHRVVGLDALIPAFSRTIRRERWARLAACEGFVPVEADVADAALLARVFADHRPGRVVHLAARTGVRASIREPAAYERANVAGTLAVFEAARAAGVGRVVYASSSSVYGAGGTPFRESDRADSPISLYAATKRACELLAAAYAHQFGMDLPGLRYFTVYGPWSRPDMAMWTFAERIANGEEVALFDGGAMRRDFTHVDDIVEGTRALLFADAVTGSPVFNIGAGRCEPIGRVVDLLAATLGRPARVRPVGPQPGDVPATWADGSRLLDAVGYRPRVAIDEGVPDFARWYAANPDIARAVRDERRAGGET